MQEKELWEMERKIDELQKEINFLKAQANTFEKKQPKWVMIVLNISVLGLVSMLLAYGLTIYGLSSILYDLTQEVDKMKLDIESIQFLIQEIDIAFGNILARLP